MVLPAKARKRVRYHHGNLPAALVEAAAELIEEQGGEGVTLRAVARRVGVTHAAPYRHFQDKAALLAAVAEASAVHLIDAMASARRGQQTAAAGLEAAGLAYLHFAAAQAARFRLMCDGQPRAAEAADDAGLDAVVRAEIERALTPLVGEVSAPLALKPASLALLLWSQWHGLSLMAVQRESPKVEELAELLIAATRLLTRSVPAHPALSTLPAAAVSVVPRGGEDR